MRFHAHATLMVVLACAGCGDDSEATDAGDADVADGDTGADAGDAGDDGADVTDDGFPPDADPTRSAGCGMPSTSPEATWVSRTIASGGTDRTLFVRLPTGYDPARAYPIVYQLHGCSSAPQRETNNVPVERESGDAAIIVRGRAAAQCWDTAETGPDVPYFDGMLADVEAAFCVDTSKRLLTGYSSGSFMTHRLACIRGAQLRGIATIAGGQAGTSCTGNVAALLIHDANDSTVNISASISARDNHLLRNACTVPAASTPTDHPPCVTYAGCSKPVTWCQTTGQDHSRQDALAAPIFWSFLSSL